MRVLVIGSGAREHALVHALRRSPGVKEVFAAPGNPGIAQAADVLSVSADDLPHLAEAASDLRVDLTVVGPELPLALGIGDDFARRHLRLFGPTRAAAELEASKVFSKEFCLRNGIPTGEAVCVRDGDDAVAAARRMGLPVVFKADGLAAGKGVIIVRSEDALEEAVDTFFVKRRFGDAGERVLVEECLTGAELSYMVITDGTRVLPLATAHDYKRVGDGDSGPNTGGMGAHSPAVLPPGTSRHILDDIVRPVVAALTSEGREYRGLLYVGLMLTDDGPKVLEFNCRLGDPETQSVLRRLDGDLAAIMRDAADGRLEPGCMRWKNEVGACVVLAAAGYPAGPRVGDEITGIEDAEALPGVVVFHAGTRRDGDRLVTAGGRVLSVTALGDTLGDAVDLAYRAADRIHFDGVHRRSDIGADTLKKIG